VHNVDHKLNYRKAEQEQCHTLITCQLNLHYNRISSV